eukprot:CAMPEP_0197659598 /NCGR_PEP_ID=MMETSP1338-20131121/48317_1 /TAXON_ID=43686 ORGANISM="Pelagodinium beii, Strain RCC1491" /NCGR_SAMPLE_ID=MMETSP1338 /ASSEMBLY_ACC=CAM_ASM_000754 /LENGTH=39 /DNA_ID= /DNA_START= /DNA_END= /DNA_ORIENTATION=
MGPKGKRSMPTALQGQLGIQQMQLEASEHEAWRAMLAGK